jgi:predicted acylesterase/phospholipase RssA
MLPGDTPVVDGLLAATALPPLFEAQQCGSAYYIDGSSVANEPTRAVLMHLTNRVNDLSTGVDVYPVASLPIGKLELPAARGEYLSAVDIAKRAIQLESFRDATLDRRMTVLLSRTLPGSQATWSPPNDARDPDAMTRYLRASVYPIELDTVNPLNGQMFAARTMEERRGLVASAVADGCRSSLEVMLASTLRAAGGNSVKCRAHLASRVDGRGFLPGSDDAQDGSGLPEVCRACVLHLSKPDGTTTEAPQSLRVPPADTEQRDVPLWPTIGQPVPAFDRQKENSRSTQGAVELDRWPAWPLDRISALETPRSDRDRPTISLLFSGGVFRGVYLAGVINGLNEVRVQPDVIAGSSIGSITAAMAARVFAVDVNDVSTRQRRILDVAATYLAVDRLVLTDRFSDFVRNFTLRSAAATFSLRALDRAFRAFDRTTSDKFGRDVRRVLAGLERLFYVSPFEAHDLIRAFRLR